mmetsp:Transcript_24832/g.69075  ORF Transcript_24832/g.69075 Transcript_24832/m.69075 type:complete len:363 (-) Transcript_24832:244-1332(-)
MMMKSVALDESFFISTGCDSEDNDFVFVQCVTPNLIEHDDDDDDDDDDDVSYDYCDDIFDVKPPCESEMGPAPFDPPIEEREQPHEYHALAMSDDQTVLQTGRANDDDLASVASTAIEISDGNSVLTVPSCLLKDLDEAHEAATMVANTSSIICNDDEKDDDCNGAADDVDSAEILEAGSALNDSDECDFRKGADHDSTTRGDDDDVEDANNQTECKPDASAVAQFKTDKLPGSAATPEGEVRQHEDSVHCEDNNNSNNKGATASSQTETPTNTTPAEVDDEEQAPEQVEEVIATPSPAGTDSQTVLLLLHPTKLSLPAPTADGQQPQKTGSKKSRLSNKKRRKQMRRMKKVTGKWKPVAIS